MENIINNEITMNYNAKEYTPQNMMSNEIDQQLILADNVKEDSNSVLMFNQVNSLLDNSQSCNVR